MKLIASAALAAILFASAASAQTERPGAVEHPAPRAANDLPPCCSQPGDHAQDVEHMPADWGAGSIEHRTNPVASQDDNPHSYTREEFCTQVLPEIRQNLDDTKVRIDGLRAAGAATDSNLDNRIAFASLLLNQLSGEQSYQRSKEICDEGNPY